MNVTTNRTIWRFEDGKLVQKQDEIAVEHAVTIRINDEEFMTVVCSPEYIEDMVVGYLASEGVIPKFSDIEELSLSEDLSTVRIYTKRKYPFYEQLLNKRYITSCCGMSRQGFVFAHDALTAKTMHEQHVKISAQNCIQLMNDLHDSAELFQNTGGVHNAALCAASGIVISRMDIGRHNALDKIYGHCLRHNIAVRDKVIVFSGRISSEILLKVAKIGCEIVLSKSAPTQLALDLAEELGITAVGFIRGKSFNVYTHPERILVK